MIYSNKNIKRFGNRIEKEKRDEKKKPETSLWGEIDLGSYIEVTYVNRAFIPSKRKGILARVEHSTIVVLTHSFTYSIKKRSIESIQILARPKEGQRCAICKLAIQPVKSGRNTVLMHRYPFSNNDSKYSLHLPIPEVNLVYE